MFYAGGLAGLDVVVLDECHYMGDEGRGTVWEEIIINAPKDVTLVALSATVKNIAEIADWISLVHRPIVPVTHPHRSVPLQYLVADLSGEIHTYETVRSGKVRLLGQEREGGYSDKGRWYTRRAVDPTVMLDELETRGWLPAIYFIFSRAGRARAMETALAEGKPPLRTRADRGSRSPPHTEPTRVAGGAAGGGLAPGGRGFMALDVREGLEDMMRVVAGPPEPVLSQFKLGYGSVALLLATGQDMATIRRTVESSFGQYQNLKKIRGLEAEVASLEMAVEDARRFTAPCGDFSRIGRYRAARAQVEQQRMARGRAGRHGRSVAEAEPGRLVLVRRKSGASLGIICGLDRRRHRMLITVLLPHGPPRQMKEGNIKKIFWQTPPLHLPRDWERRTRSLAAQLQALSVPEALGRRRGQGPDGALPAHECHRCPWGSQSRCDHSWKGVEALEGRLGQKREMLDAFKNAYSQ